MTKTTWKPWHEVVPLRQELRTGELTLSLFAADLDEVAMRRGRRPEYEDPERFFALTYATHNLRELAKEVVDRLQGRSDKAVRQLELTYGGGKTHALITLYHLVHRTGPLPDLPPVREFVEHIGYEPSKAAVAVLPFDKLDVEKGMAVRGPSDETRWLRQPWSVLAYQIAGEHGLRLLHPDDRPEERESAPAENLLAAVLEIPVRDGLGVLVLIDEVLMYAREKVGLAPEWRGRLLNFFQALTQAATRVDRCAVVASLLATDPRKSDALGKEIIQELYAIFGREREQAIEPVVKEDVAEVLRRRLFDPAAIANPERFRPHVVAALKGVYALDEPSRRRGPQVEEEFLRSYPFHPEFTKVLYAKWTQLEGFQRTRGVLRTFALALREAERWDTSPLVGPSVLLSEPETEDLSEALRELAAVARAEEYEGRRQEWSAILREELGKAREIERELPGLHHREVEAAVVATFLHSQPIGQKATTRELVLLLAPTRPDRIELEEGLTRWAEVSWFLDEAAIGTGGTRADGRPQLPREWRLGTRPNLRQMHHDAVTGLESSYVVATLREIIAATKSLTAGAAAAGARVHLLPAGPQDVQDDGNLHLVVLGPEAASAAGRPSPLARRYIVETTSADRPRVYQNAIVVAVPSREGVAALDAAVREYLGWEEVRARLKDQPLDPIRDQMLAGYIRKAKDALGPAVRAAYNVVVTMGEEGEVQAFRLGGGSEGPLFQAIKADPRSRIQEGPVSPDALLPGGPYELWREDEPSRRLCDLVTAFGQFPRLPKILRRDAVVETVLRGCQEGIFVLTLSRPDGTRRTWWWERPEPAALDDAGLEVVLPQHAELTSLDPALLEPGRLPGLWDGEAITVADVERYFVGGHTVAIQRDGYEEHVVVPKAPPEVVREAVERAVEAGTVWLSSPPASLWKEAVPPGVVQPQARLLPPPEPIPPAELLPDNLPEAWSDGATTAGAMAAALSAEAGVSLPWVAVREVIDAALRAGYLVLGDESAPWPCDLSSAPAVRLIVPSGRDGPPEEGARVRQPPAAVRVASAALEPHELQDLADRIGELVEALAGLPFRLEVRLEVGAKEPPPPEVEERVNRLLAEINDGLRLK